MSTESLLPAPHVSVPVARTMNELAEHRMLAPARSAGIELQFLGITHPPVHEQEHKLPSGIWKFVDHVNDPTAREFGGKIPIPQAKIAELVQLRDACVCPQHLWIVHQMPHGYQPGEPTPQLVPVPRELREKDERLQVGLTAATRLFVKGAAVTLAAAAAPGAAILSAGAGALVGLDPVILGGVEHPTLPLFAWCAPAQWDWE